MDQLKVALKYLKKYHFWLLCLVAMITGLVGWTMASSALTTTYSAQKIAIIGKFKSLQDIQQDQNPPNAQWKEGISKLTDEERKKVGSAWTLVYGQQKQLLQWPEMLGPKFLQFVSDPANGQTAEFHADLRATYGNTINAEFPKLLQIIGAEPADTKSAQPGKPGQPAEPAAKPAAGGVLLPTTEWVKEDQDRIQRSLQFPQLPTSQQIRLTQEDLWVYQALLHIVRKINEGHHVAPIKRIASMKIGEMAASQLEDGMKPDRIYRLQLATAEAPAAQPMPPAGETGPKPLDENRYVSADGKPLAGGATANDQFKRMPISLRLIIDQREINRLLVECANSPLPVEVRQLRINTGGSNQRSSEGTSVAQSSNQSSAKGLTDSFDVPIDLQGIIYIFNPPDPAQLGGAAGSTTAAATAPAAPPGG